MCDHPNREAAMVVIARRGDGTPTIWCDPCLAPLVRALNSFGMLTIASCCGHGRRPGRIDLKDGRALFLTPDFDTASKVDDLLMDRAGFADINAPITPTTASVPTYEEVRHLWRVGNSRKEPSDG